MKAIIIFLLVLILGILGYNFYNTWQRFHPPNYHYTSETEVPKSHENKALLLNYYEAVEKLNGYVITQWSANDIDVRNPDDDDATTIAAVVEYTDKLATVRFFESQLMAPEFKGELELTPELKRKQLIEKMFYLNPSQNTFKIGDQNALVFEVQRLLIKKGHNIKNDGLYRSETQTALKEFEGLNNLYPDGKMDALTLDALLK